MSSLYVDRKNVALKSEGEALVFMENDRRAGTIPLRSISRLIVRGDIQMSTSLLGKLGEKGIGVILLSGRKGTPSLFMGRAHNDAARRVAQYRAFEDTAFCLERAKRLMTEKLSAQHEWLSLAAEAHPAHRRTIMGGVERIRAGLGKITTQKSMRGLRGQEGAAANAYFSALAAVVPAGLGFEGRNRRPPRDPFNALLSLGYTLLHSQAVLAIHEAGFDPFIGFYHDLDFGRESLACDLVEPLRPEVDRFALGLFESKALGASDFSNTDTGCLLAKTGRSRFYAAFEEQAPLWRKALSAQIEGLLEPVMAYAPKGRP